MTSAKPEIALVVASYNREKPLLELLENLRNQTLLPRRWEVWIAVDGSTDGTMDMLSKWDRKNKNVIPLHFFYQANSGQAKARHEAILRTEAERIVVIDDDMEVSPDFLTQHLKAAQEDPKHIVVIGKVMPRPKWRQFPLYSAVVEQGMQELHARLEKGAHIPSGTSFVTQNVSFPRALYLQTGGFDFSLRLDEDREMGLRLERNGGRFIFSRYAWAVHHSNIGAYETWRKRQYEYGLYAVKVWNKFHGDVYVHPLRNFATGSRMNHWAVRFFVPFDHVANLATHALRWIGVGLQKLRIYGPAIATHKAILALQYHLGVKHALGSWKELLRHHNAYLSDENSPKTPTGEGMTMNVAAHRD